MVDKAVILGPDAHLDLLTEYWHSLKVRAITGLRICPHFLSSVGIPETNLEAGRAASVAHAFSEIVPATREVSELMVTMVHQLLTRSIEVRITMRLHTHLAGRLETDRGATVLKLSDFRQY